MWKALEDIVGILGDIFVFLKFLDLWNFKGSVSLVSMFLESEYDRFHQKRLNSVPLKQNYNGVKIGPKHCNKGYTIL